MMLRNKGQKRLTENRGVPKFIAIPPERASIAS
jgi:hypothetical protein